jgi:maltoporin
VVKAEFYYFQVQGKGAPVDSVELGQPVLGVAHVSQSVVATPSVRVDDRFQIGMTADQRSDSDVSRARSTLSTVFSPGH